MMGQKTSAAHKKAITRTLFSGAVRLIRGTSVVVGLAVMMALMVGAASSALAGTGVGGVFNLGKTNTVNAITKLVGGVPGAGLVVDNNSTDPAATALNLKVEPGKAPMKVDSQTKVDNLNADTVDGHDAPLWAVVYFNGTLERGHGVTATSNDGPGEYRVTFDRDVSGCAYSALISESRGGEISTFRKVFPNPTMPDQVSIATHNSAGTLENRAFHLIVTC
jgi:hypothetical protein